MTILVKFSEISLLSMSEGDVVKVNNRHEDGRRMTDIL